MKLSWTSIQHMRLSELNAGPDELQIKFEDAGQRNAVFQKLEKKLVKEQKNKLEDLRQIHFRPQTCRLQSQLVEALVKEKFVQVTTPTIMSKGLLAKMSITDDHPLNSQIFWLEKNKCLRPMLAPHLYYVIKDLLRLWEKPIRIFEIGSCFRKESEGARHSNEFTMLNLCEFGLPSQDREKRLNYLASLIMEVAGIDEYALESETSTVYGSTIDVLAPGDLELGSGAMGPHHLDEAWKISETWVGIGFGIERLLMAKEKTDHLGKFSRSLSYLDGIRLNL